MSTIQVPAPKPATKRTSLAAAQSKLKQISTALQEIQADIIVIEEDCCEPASKDDLEEMAGYIRSSLDYFYSMINDLYSRIYQNEDKMYEMFWQHQKGHIPAINSVEQMTRAIEALGLSSEIEVQKRVIYSSDGKASKIQWEIPVK